MGNSASSVSSSLTGGPEGGNAHRRQPGNRLQVLEGALRQAMENGAQVPEAFAAYCAEAFSRADWIDGAVEFLLEVFADDESELARLVRVPDLVTELALGGAALTCTVASHWNATGEAARMAHLADMVRSAHVQMKSPHAVEVMLVLAASLGITRPSRARSLLGIASLRATPGEHDDALRQARIWVSVGEVVEDSPVEEREFWDARLRSRSRSYTWDTVEERRALTHLVERLDPGSSVGPLFQSVVPGCWWDLLQKHHYDEVARNKVESSPSVLVDPSVASAHELATESDEPSAAQRPSHLLPVPPNPGASKPAHPTPRHLPAFVFGLVLGSLVVVGIQYFEKLVPQKPSSHAVAMAAKANPTVEPVSLEPAAATVDWCENEAMRLKSDLVDAAMFEAVKSGKWQDHEVYLRGQTTRLPQASGQYLTLMRLLHLDLPQDPELVRMVPRLLALRGLDRSTVELWEHSAGKSQALAVAIRQIAKEVLETQGVAVPEDLRARLEGLSRE